MPPGDSRGFARPILGRQRLPHIIGARVDGTGTASMLEGGQEITLTDNGTGDYTLTFGTAFARVPVVVASPLTADAIIQIGTISASAVQILGFDATDGTTAKDIDFHVMILGWDTADVV